MISIKKTATNFQYYSCECFHFRMNRSYQYVGRQPAFLLRGPPGKPGRDGMPGSQGTSGSPGKAGKDGSPGKPGKDGSPGSQGTPGSPGLNGRDGRHGAQGAPGNYCYFYFRRNCIRTTSFQ